MILHQNQEEFRELIQLTSTATKIPLVYVEKDYYVTLALKELSKSTAFKAKGIFKGGTSLSKAYKLIERFSEDIDIGILSDNLEGVGAKNAMRSLEKVLIAPDIFTELTESNDGRVRKLKHFRRSICNYPKLFEGDFHQASTTLLIEINRFTPSIPSEEKYIQTYIADFLESTAQNDAITEYELQAFGVNVMSLERTFIEKVLGIIKKCFLDNPIEKLKPKIRHLYDIYFLMKEPKIKEFLDNKSKINNLNSFEFFNQTILDELVGTKEAGFDSSWMNLKFSDAIIFKDLDNTWNKLNNEYNQNFSLMVYGILPGPDDIKKSIAELNRFINNFDNWRNENNITV